VIRKLARLAGISALAAVLAACGADNGQSDQAEPEAVVEAPAEEPAADVADFLGRDDEPDGMDCEADDKAAKEIPDCGFYAGPGNKTFYWWSWVKAGKATPPAGWSATDEVRAYRPASPAAAPKPTRKAVTPRPKASPSKSRARS
jgi:hypothetical protein